MHFLKNIIKDSLIKNSIYLITTNILNLILGFFFWIIAARKYSSDDVGIASTLISSMFLIVLISTFGFQTAFQFFLPRDRKNAKKIINSCLTTSIIASLLFSLIFIIGIDIWASPLKLILNDLKLASSFILITTAMTVSGIISGAFIAGKKSSFHMTKETFFGFMKIIPLPFLMYFSAMGIYFAWGIGLMISIILGFVLLPLAWKDYFPF